MFIKLKSQADYKNMTKWRKVMFKKPKKTPQNTQNPTTFSSQM